MGEMADGVINGDFDFYAGEYIGRGYGIPRTKNKALSWEKKQKKVNTTNYTVTPEMAYNGVKNYISIKWSGRPDMPNIRQLLYEYTGESNFDLKKKCVEIQKDFKSFVQFINKKLNK